MAKIVDRVVVSTEAGTVQSIAWMTRGARRLRYLGTTKNNAWWQLRAAAINLRKLTQLGLNTSSTGWVLT